jgi:hypothetical protein
MRKLLHDNKHDLALVIGNGVNRYGAGAGTNAWEDLLTHLARLHLDPAHDCIPKGMSPTEFFDVLEMALDAPSGVTSLQARFCEQMATWTPLPQHHAITAWAIRHRVPMLTTNFDNTLGAACGARLRRCGKDAFTAYYPWSTCYACAEVLDPLTDFAVWHIHGMQRYRQSIRLGLSHYMGSVERARGWLHKSGTKLFGANDIRAWPGANTWLQVFLHKPLLIFGFGLGENEVFLRWLLIERAKYFKKLPARAKPGWYVHVEGSPDIDPGKALFLKGMGITPISVPAFSNIYDEGTWR